MAIRFQKADYIFLVASVVGFPNVTHEKLGTFRRGSENGQPRVDKSFVGKQRVLWSMRPQGSPANFRPFGPFETDLKAAEQAGD